MSGGIPTLGGAGAAFLPDTFNIYTQTHSPSEEAPTRKALAPMALEGASGTHALEVAVQSGGDQETWVAVVWV